MNESNSQPQKTSKIRTVSDVLSALQNQSDAHHKELANKFLALSIAVAYGSLAYLISLEQLLPPATSGGPLAIQIAWCAAYISVVFGSLHLWLEMLLPRHAYNMAVEAIRDMAILSEEEIESRSYQKTQRFLFYGWIHHVHIISLLLVIIASAYYRFYNL